MPTRQKVSFHATPSMYIVNSLTTRDAKQNEFPNSVDLDEVAHNEPPHLDLHCFPTRLCILNMIQLGRNIF